MRPAPIMAATALALACAQPAPTPAGGTPGEAAVLEGRWTLCMTETSRNTGPLCAGLTAGWRSGGAGERAGGRPDMEAGHYALTHRLPLDSLLGVAHPLPPYGVIAPAEGGGWRLLLGVDSGVVNIYDAGLHGTLSASGDSLEGHWSHSCFAGCREEGTVTLTR